MNKINSKICVMTVGVFMAMSVASSILAVTILIASKTEVNK